MTEKVRIVRTAIKNVDLKKIRKKAGLSLRKLGELSGVNFALISKFENGFIMSEKDWNLIAKVLDDKK